MKILLSAIVCTFHGIASSLKIRRSLCPSSSSRRSREIYLNIQRTRRSWNKCDVEKCVKLDVEVDVKLVTRFVRGQDFKQRQHTFISGGPNGCQGRLDWFDVRARTKITDYARNFVFEPCGKFVTPRISHKEAGEEQNIENRNKASLDPMQRGEVPWAQTKHNSMRSHCLANHRARQLVVDARHGHHGLHRDRDDHMTARVVTKNSRNEYQCARIGRR